MRRGARAAAGAASRRARWCGPAREWSSLRRTSRGAPGAPGAPGPGVRTSPPFPGGARGRRTPRTRGSPPGGPWNDDAGRMPRGKSAESSNGSTWPAFRRRRDHAADLPKLTGRPLLPKARRRSPAFHSGSATASGTTARGARLDARPELGVASWDLALGHADGGESFDRLEQPCVRGMPGRESECSGTGRRSPVPELLLPGDPDTPCGYRRLAPAPEASRNASDPQDGPVPSVRTEVLMARITVEDCAQFVDNRFALCILGTRRARQLASGATPLVQTQRNKSAVVALREVATGKVRFEGDVRAALSKPPPKRGILEAAVNATEIDRAKGPDPFGRSSR